MLTVAKRNDPEPETVLPVTTEWRLRVRAELAKERGAAARLASAIGCSTGTLSEMLEDRRDPNESRYSRYVEPINAYFKWPSMLPLSHDTAEIQHLLTGLGGDAKEILAALRDMPRAEARAMIALILARKSGTSS